MPVLQLGPQRSPLYHVPWPQFGDDDLSGRRRDRRHDAHGPTHAQRCWWSLPPGCPAFMVARRPEVLLQRVIRSRNLGIGIAMEQPRPIPVGHPVHVRGPRTQLLICRVRQHLREHTAQGSLDRRRLRTRRVRQHVRHA